MAFEKQIDLFGERYLLIGDMETGGAIATIEAYENFECSYAHLKEDGKIVRFGKVIGSREDITLSTVMVDAGQDLGALPNLLNHPSWKEPKCKTYTPYYKMQLEERSRC